MFCPKCGNAEQLPESFCRRCGTFLPDFDKAAKKEITPQQHLTANLALSILTAIVSISLAIALYTVFLGGADTHWIIYLTAGFLIAISAWQAQTIWRTTLLRKQLKRKNYEENLPQKSVEIKAAKTAELLTEADYSDFIGQSVTENTTTKLGEKIKRQ